MPPTQLLPFVPEVELVHAVHGCRQCDWLWQTPRLYGPFPQCDAQKLPNTAGAVSQAAKIEAFDLPAPAVLRGCRKAPVMIVGINPNLTGHFTLPRKADETLPKGARAVYPRFSDVKAYAQHYRFIERDVHEYQMGEAQVEGLVETNSDSLKASWSGKVLPAPKEPTANDTRRDETKRAAWLSLDRDNSEEQALVSRSWSVKENHVVLHPKFDEAKMIAGVMTQASTVGKSLDVNAIVGSSYYRTAQAIADKAQLDLGEDVSMHDMMACATPSWERSQMAQLHTQCVEKNQYTAKQIRQSRPSLILFSGSAAFEMFFTTFAAYIVEPVDMSAVGKAVKKGGPGFSTVFTLRMPASGSEAAWDAALLVLGHLSYPVAPAKFFSLKSEQWQSFSEKHPAAWMTMVGDEEAGAEFISSNTLENWRSFIDGLQAETVQDIEELIGDPRRDAVVALVAKMKADGRLRVRTGIASPTGKTRIGGLQRNTENCKYCPTFAVPGGCVYEAGNTD